MARMQLPAVHMRVRVCMRVNASVRVRVPVHVFCNGVCEYRRARARWCCCPQDVLTRKCIASYYLGFEKDDKFMWLRERSTHLKVFGE
eukprot:4955583-Pleurochrysis_carterae.AAC.1